MASSNGSFFRVTGPLCTGELPSQRASNANFDISLVWICINCWRAVKKLETTWRSCNIIVIMIPSPHPPCRLSCMFYSFGNSLSATADLFVSSSSSAFLLTPKTEHPSIHSCFILFQLSLTKFTLKLESRNFVLCEFHHLSMSKRATNYLSKRGPMCRLLQPITVAAVSYWQIGPAKCNDVRDAIFS